MRPSGAHPVYWRTFTHSQPDDWVLRAFRDLADNFKGKLPDDLSPVLTPESIPYLLVEGFEKGEWSFTCNKTLPYVFETDCIIVADGSRSGLALRGKAGALGSTLLCYRPKEEVDPDFFFYLLQSFYAFTNTATIGGAVPHLDTRLLDKLQLHIPPLIEEQASIGIILKAADNALAAAEAKLTAAKRLKTALMQQLFTRGIPGRHKEFIQTKWFYTPASWITRQLRQIAKVESGFTMGRDLSGHELVEVAYLTVVNVQEGGFDLSNVERVEVKQSELDRLLVGAGDILMTEGGDRDKLGRGGMWRGEIQPCVYQNHIFRVRLAPDTYKPELFHFLLQTWQAKNYFFAHAKQTSNLCTINSRELKRFPVFEPSVAEQEQMIELLSAADAQVASVKSEVQALHRLKRSLLQNLLTGKVRVKSLDVMP